MSKKNQHVVPKGDEWGVRDAGNPKLTRVISTQAEAIRIAKIISINQKSEMLIHGKNGEIREKNIYSNDGFPPNG